MAEQERFETWLAKVCERPMPQNPVARARSFARELAEGAFIDEPFWDMSFDRDPFAKPDNLTEYLSRRWRHLPPDYERLRLFEWLAYQSGKYYLTKAAFELIEETEPATVFISYRRDQSSAFALLVLARLKQHGLEAFLDMTLQPGEEWHAGLKERIQQYDYFVVLLSKTTLESEFVRKEILWAQEANLTILPIWHNGFEQNRVEALRQLEQDESGVREVINNIQPIRVTDESALGYNTAIVELLNRFGVTPE